MDGGAAQGGAAGVNNIRFPYVRLGSEVRAHRGLESGLDTRDKPTLAAVALLHLKRMAAIRAAEGHLIERVNGRFGPFVTNAAPSTFRR
jgi:topoisomerase IA-like protein